MGRINEQLEEQQASDRERMLNFYQRNPFFAIPSKLRTLAMIISFAFAIALGSEQSFIVFFLIMLATLATFFILLTLGIKYGYIRRATNEELLPRHMR